MKIEKNVKKSVKKFAGNEKVRIFAIPIETKGVTTNDL